MIKRKIAATAAAVLLGVGLAVSAGSPAFADTLGPFALQDLMSPSKCITQDHNENGSRPYIVGCTYNLYQNFYFDRVAGTSNVYEIRTETSDYWWDGPRCLDVRDWNPNQFAIIQTWHCNHTYNQQFTVTAASTGAAQLHNWAGWCITVEGVYPYDYTGLFMNNCSPELGRNMWWLY